MADQEIPDRATAEAAEWLSNQNPGFETPTFWHVASLLAIYRAEARLVAPDRRWTDQDLYDAYLWGCEDECLPEPLTKEQFVSKWTAIENPTFSDTEKAQSQKGEPT